MEKEILSTRQQELLKLLSKQDFIQNFYLTGGTALAFYYLKHRYSEDLDFFSEKEIDVLALTVSLEIFKNQLPLKKIDFQKSFNRNLYFFHFMDGEIIKTEFTYFPFLRLEEERNKDELEIDSLLDIAVNKVFTIYQQSRARDFVDLYFIMQSTGWTLLELVKKVRIKFDWPIDWLNLGTQLIKIKDLKDYPRMIKSLDQADLTAFFIEEAKKLGPEIIAE